MINFQHFCSSDYQNFLISKYIYNVMGLKVVGAMCKILFIPTIDSAKDNTPRQFIDGIFVGNLLMEYLYRHVIT